MFVATRYRLILLLAWILASCVGARPGGQTTENAPGAGDSWNDTRTLAADATFKDLVASMRHVDGLRRRKKGCLLSQRPQGFRFQAPVLSMVEPIPDAPKELDKHLKATERLRVITEDGFLGPPTTVAFATLTSSEIVASYGIVVVLTNEGVYVRSSDFDREPGASALPAKDEELPALLSTAAGMSTLYVSAEADVPLQRLYNVLSILDKYGPVVFVLAVRSAPEDLASSVDATCPVVALSSEQQRATPQITQRASKIQADLVLCSNKVQAERPNGRVLVAVQYRPDGSIQAGCVKEDQTGSETLRACLRDVVRAEPAAGALPDSETRTLLTAMTISRPRSSWSFAGDAVCR
jgi:hypothetical protein